MYEGFSGQARKAIQLAHEEARRRQHDYVGTEHLLLGTLREGSASVAGLLAATGVEVEAVYRAVEAHMPPGVSGPGWDQLPLTPGAKRALEDARREAAGLRHASIGPEDLLLGLLGNDESSAAQALLSLGLSLERLRQEAAKLPATENRDWLLRPERTPGGPVRGDPSAGDIAAVVTAEVLPPSVQRPQRDRRITLAPEGAPRPRPRPDDAALDLPVVQQQLRVLQVVIAVVGGGVVGAQVVGLVGTFCGILVGLVLALTRNNFANAVLGTAAGAVYALYAYPYQLPLCALWGLIGLVVGACLGDWRAMPAPPGSDPGPPTREKAADPEDEP